MELLKNLVDALSQCGADIQQRMLWHFSQADAEYGRRVAQGLGVSVPTSRPAGVKDDAGHVAEVGGAVG